MARLSWPRQPITWLQTVTIPILTGPDREKLSQCRPTRSDEVILLDMFLIKTTYLLTYTGLKNWKSQTFKDLREPWAYLQWTIPYTNRTAKYIYPNMCPQTGNVKSRPLNRRRRLYKNAVHTVINMEWKLTRRQLPTAHRFSDVNGIRPQATLLHVITNLWSTQQNLCCRTLATINWQISTHA